MWRDYDETAIHLHGRVPHYCTGYLRIRLSAVSMSADGMLFVVITPTALMYVAISALYLTLRNIASLSRKRQHCIVYCRNQLYIKLH